MQPIAFTLDDRGRLWVAEAYTYPVRAPEGQGQDRILIFEDTDGDGRLDSRKVFIENLNLVSGIEVGFGGVWVGAAPYLLFIPDRGRHRPSRRAAAGPARRLGLSRTRTRRSTRSSGARTAGSTAPTASSPTRTSASPARPTPSACGSTPASGAIHPTQHVFEVFAEGTSNPWGLDFNDHGQAFITACVIPHLFHMIQGGRYKRQAGQHFNPYTYDDIKTIADHLHYVGKQGAARGQQPIRRRRRRPRPRRRDDLSRRRHWPEEYRGAIFMNNIHGAAHEHRSARSARARATSPRTARTS